jgi:hypothetical protein
LNLTPRKGNNQRINLKKKIFKLMNNIVYGKMIENVRKYIDFELVTIPQYF